MALPVAATAALFVYALGMVAMLVGAPFLGEDEFSDARALLLTVLGAFFPAILFSQTCARVKGDVGSLK